MTKGKGKWEQGTRWGRGGGGKGREREKPGKMLSSTRAWRKIIINFLT